MRLALKDHGGTRPGGLELPDDIAVPSRLRKPATVRDVSGARASRPQDEAGRMFLLIFAGRVGAQGGP
jgi:hypothetical protein